ncbi:hypothetical protein NDU88_004932 [Pleurodeles waltl]|uniref:Uncharacterized protein n=1 Tax=Pleurodeles waltl TaxID=8319 RepID=A0AAV7TTC6_PLEWA|nr:hypothetical protein NDU88_004932 [Pleurodeles waltl]
MSYRRPLPRLGHTILMFAERILFKESKYSVLALPPQRPLKKILDSSRFCPEDEIFFGWRLLRVLEATSATSAYCISTSSSQPSKRSVPGNHLGSELLPRSSVKLPEPQRPSEKRPAQHPRQPSTTSETARGGCFRIPLSDEIA